MPHFLPLAYVRYFSPEMMPTPHRLPACRLARSAWTSLRMRGALLGRCSPSARQFWRCCRVSEKVSREERTRRGGEVLGRGSPERFASQAKNVRCQGAGLV